VRLSQQPAWHFYVDDDLARAVVDWDPDEEPQRFASGVGHNLLELYSRLRTRGLPVTIGTSIPADTELVVYFQQAWDRLGELRIALSAAPFHTVVIRSDAPLWWWPLLPADLAVVPNEAPVWRDRLGGLALHLPALPQRGMLARAPSRVGVQTLAFKGNPESVPGYVREPDFLAALQERGITLLLDTPVRTDGDDQNWHDFHQVDAVLCLRGAAADDPLTNKPATRLVNAWCAGAVPLVGPEPAYLELIHDGVDGFVVEGPQDILRTLDLLSSDDERTTSVFAAVKDRSCEFQVHVLLDRWVAALEGASGQRHGPAQTTARRLVVIGRFTRWATRGVLRRAHGLRRLKLHRL
jgi:hypothetical protein